MSELDDYATREGLFELENFGLLTPLDGALKGEIWNANAVRLHRLAREQIRAALPKERRDSVRQAIRNKAKEALESDSNAFFQPGADQILTAIFEFYLELVSEWEESFKKRTDVDKTTWWKRVASFFRRSKQPEIDWNLTWTLGSLGRLFRRFDRMTQARTSFSEGRTTIELLAESFPDNLSVKREVNAFYNKLGDLELAEGNARQARESRLHCRRMVS